MRFIEFPCRSFCILQHFALDGSKQCAGSFAASLIDRILDSVPAGSKLGLNAVLFLQCCNKNMYVVIYMGKFTRKGT